MDRREFVKGMISLSLSEIIEIDYEKSFYFEVYKEKVPRLILFNKNENTHDISKLFETNVALGTKKKPTPSGTFYLRRIVENPFWYPPSWSKQKKPSKPGKNNPYGVWMSELSKINAPGDYDFSVSGDTQIRLHSTNAPESIGTYSSHGCIRLHPNVAEELFPYLLEHISHLPPKKNSRGTIYPLKKTIPITIK